MRTTGGLNMKLVACMISGLFGILAVARAGPLHQTWAKRAASGRKAQKELPPVDQTTA